MPRSASLQLATGRFEPGKLDFKGSQGLAPLQAQGQLVLQRMPVQAFEPYFGEQLNIDLRETVLSDFFARVIIPPEGAST